MITIANVVKAINVFWIRIQPGITRVVNRIGDDGIEIIDVQNWIVNDESIQPKAEAE